MRVAVMTIGSRGDVQPFLALAAGLQRRGFDVTLATHEPFRRMVVANGVSFASLPGDPREIVASPESRRLMSTGRSLIRFTRRFVDLLEPWFGSLVDAAAPLHAAADLVVVSPLAFPSWHLSELDGTPVVLASLQPLPPTRSFPTVALGGLDLGGWGNLATHRVAQHLWWQPLRPLVNRWRTRDLALPPLGCRPPWGSFHSGAPVVHGFSEAVVPRPPDWGPAAHITGYWFADEPEPQPPPGLTAFIDDGPPPVYVGFGSAIPSEAGELAAICVQAARLARMRVVLGQGWAGLSHPGSDVFPVGDIPHGWLFPRMGALVHHGGAGTTGSGLRAGVPTVVVPFYADQPFWGARVAAIGAGPTPIPRRRLTVSRLANALTATRLPPIVQQAARIGARIRQESGVARAVDVISDAAIPARGDGEPGMR